MFEMISIEPPSTFRREFAMQRAHKVPSTIAAFVFSITACVMGFFLPASVAAQASSRGPVIYLDQAWSQGEREWYYQFSQGSTVISYDIFLNLEVASGQELFRSDENSERYGLIAQPANASSNPDGLPIGLAKTAVTKPLMADEHAGEYIGLTCAACHNAQLQYQGKRIRIDGGVGNTFDLMSYIYALDDALQATLKDTAKFDRLASRLKAADSNAQGRSAQTLRDRCGTRAPVPHAYAGRARRSGDRREWTLFR